MTWPSILTQAQFEQGARAWAQPADVDQADDRLGAAQAAKGWQWVEHEYVAGMGHLTKRVTVRLSGEAERVEETGTDDGPLNDPLGIDDDDDEAAVALNATAQDNWATATLSICCSPTYQVPVLYFNVFSTSGSPLPLTAILDSSLFHRHDRRSYPFTTIPPSINGSEKISVCNRNATAHTTTALDTIDLEPAPPAPFVSQAEHPTLGTPAWFLHPCETQAIVAEVLSTRPRLTKEASASEQEWESEWVESWAMVVGGVVDMRG